MFIYDNTPDSLNAASSLIATRACRHGDRAASAPSIQPVVSSLTSPASGWRYFTSMATPLFGLTRHPFRTWLVLHAGVCSHACRRSSCVSVVTSPRRGDPVDGEPWCCCAQVDARFSPVQPKMVAVHASAHSVASSEWIICLDKRWETPRPNAIFTCVQFIVRRGCNKVTAVTYIWTGIM